jgi:hypothetical protein
VDDICGQGTGNVLRPEGPHVGRIAQDEEFSHEQKAPHEKPTSSAQDQLTLVTIFEVASQALLGSEMGRKQAVKGRRTCEQASKEQGTSTLISDSHAFPSMYLASLSE